MIVSAWNNGSYKKTGGGYGIRIRKIDRDQYFEKKRDFITIQIDNEEVQINISSSFWNKCPELRSEKIGKWLINKGYQKWPKGKPPKFRLIPMNKYKFMLI